MSTATPVAAKPKANTPQPVKIGPFTGGLNTYSDPAAVADTDAVDMINFEVDLDGSLRSRPPFTVINSGQTKYNNRLLGIYTTTAGISYLIFSNVDGTGTGNTSYYRLDNGTTGLVTNTIAASAMVQYLNKAWLIAPPGSANPGGNWDGTTFTAVAAIQKGVSATVYKERIFVATGALDTTNPSRVFFSGAANPTSWTGTDFFDINNGDGQAILKIYAFSGAIVVFKTRVTFTFAYDTSPTKGQIQSVSNSVGLDDTDCVAESEGILYLLSNSRAYSISNWTWNQINVKVPFAYVNAHTNNTRSNFSVSAFGNRIVFRYYDTMYVYGTKTKAWSRWLSTLCPDYLVKSPIIDVATGIETYYGGNYLVRAVGAAADSLFKIKDTYTAVDSETFTCSVRTKVYSMEVPYSFKRLMWWGMDILAKAHIDVSVIPVTYSIPVTWAQMAPRTWGQVMAAGGTWGRPLDVSINVSDSVDIMNNSGIRTFIRYIKSLRFRQVQFTVSSTIDGSTATGPLNIYSMVAYVVNKQLVSKKIN
jgi:hypothetical protein